MNARQRVGQRRSLLILAVALGLALIAAACSDDDFDGGAEDRGAVAAASAGSELSAAEQQEAAAAAEDQSEQAADVEDVAEEQVAEVAEEADEDEAEEVAVVQSDEAVSDDAGDQAEDEGADDEAVEEQVEEEPVVESDENDDPAVVADLSDAAAGRELFFANGCNACHGDSGEGNIGPTIAQTGFSLGQVIGQYRNPRSVMPPFLESAVSDAQVADIYAWLRTQPIPETIVPGLGTPQ